MAKQNPTDCSTPMAASLTTFAVFSALLLRVLVGYQPHSGMENHHGSKKAYGGDYEAQRHWMEMTWNLPSIGDWYWYDLQYWGLDYPPLTAYVSCICGALSEFIVGPETVALYDSRGYEDPTHKAFMRATVWVLELLIYFPAVSCILKLLWVSKRQQSTATAEYGFETTLLLALLQPAIILIDHGHFQYNTVALGLSLWSLYFIAHPSFYLNCIWGSVFFCGALNFKQMTLYYAPAIFAYLLGRCFAPITAIRTNPSQSRKEALQRFLALGITVIFVFLLLWFPFLIFGPGDEDLSHMGSLSKVLHRGKHVLHRIFPLERGLFEGKVANFWCALDTKPLNIRDRIPTSIQPLAALALTFTLMFPSCVVLFLTGKRSESKIYTPQQHASHVNSLLWGATSCALSFFLASFQVHEKSILLALAPASLLAWDDTLFCNWFAIVAAWTMWPLLVVDRLQIAYTCCILIFSIFVHLIRPTKPKLNKQLTWFTLSWEILCKLSFVAMVGMHALEIAIEPPPHLPDLFPVLWSVGGCALCCLAWVKTIASLISAGNSMGGKPKGD